MADVHSKGVRSYNMSRIKAVDTKPEMLVRKFLHSKGIRYSLHNRKLPGKPDLTLTRYKTVIFVNGCFWHGHKDCKYFVIPKTRTEWWKNKIESNIKRDKEERLELEKYGWNILTVWECELKPFRKQETLEKIYNSLQLFGNG